jgi:type 1 glutamine amidotransferase
MKRALIVWGGWDGHEPQAVAELFDEMLKGEGVDTVVSDTLDSFTDADLMASVNLIVPIWTMGEITSAQCDPVVAAVRDRGVGMAGCHGGMCDSFRSNTEWQFMTGGQWVAHPGNDGVRYTVNMTSVAHPITEGLNDFEVVSEQYYLHTDPGNLVLATTHFPHPDHTDPHGENPCEMPQVWVRKHGRGRVFYSALGHSRSVLETGTSRELMRRGFHWAMA